MKRILCPVDFSDTATNAVEYAANFSKLSNAELILFHIINEPSLESISNITGGGEKSKSDELEILERLEIYCQTIKSSFSIQCLPKIEVYTSNMEGALKKEIESENYDMVVMGTEGTTDIGQLFLGTHTNHIIGSISLPILVIPTGCSFKEIKSIVYASDYKIEDIPALSSVMTITQVFDPNLTVLHVNKKRSKKDEEILLLLQDVYQDKLKNDKIAFDQIQGENIAMALDSYVTNHDADILVLVTHKYSWLERLFHESVSKKMSLVADYPILIQHFSQENS